MGRISLCSGLLVAYGGGMSKPQVELIELGAFKVWQCVDCGASSERSETDIRHHQTCKPGEAERWRKYYNGTDDDDEC
jgi:hypothetical protein